MDALNAILVAADMASARRRVKRVQRSHTYRNCYRITLSSEYSHKSGSVMRPLPRFPEPGQDTTYTIVVLSTIHYLYHYVIRNLSETRFVGTQEKTPSLLMCSS